ncbi:MAG: hypothetical protein NC311_17210 [Muribaculaceae bacterium]|nr:hypothetical protein [Muribaculaceae bacterium]
MASKAADKVAAGVLKANPDLKEVYVTSDGVAFYTRNDAQNHANSLKNRELYKRKRDAAHGDSSSEGEEKDELTPGSEESKPETDTNNETTDEKSDE